MRLLWLVPVALLAGCATGLRVAYQSDPPGATLYQEGAPMGTTPYILTYQPDDTFKKGGCMRLRGTSVKWASGAEASIAYLQACASNGWQQHYTFSRPDVPGRDVDANFALQLQRNSIMRQQADAADTAATLQLLRALTPPPPAPMPMPTTCTTRAIGTTLQTQCF